MAESSVKHAFGKIVPSRRAREPNNPSLPLEVLSKTIAHLTSAELYNVIAINKQWFNIVIQRIWHAVHFVDFMKITEGGRQRVASGSRQRTSDSSWDGEEEDRLNRNQKRKPLRHKVSPEDARRLAIYSPNIVTLRWDDPSHYSSSSYEVVREFSRMIDGWCETICQVAVADPSFWPNGAKAPSMGSRITKTQISTSQLFPGLSYTSLRHETHWERIDFEVPFNPVHGLLHLPLTMDLPIYERFEDAARNSSKICFTNGVAHRRCNEMACQQLLSNLRGNSNLRDLELCFSRHSRIVHSGYGVTPARGARKRTRRVNGESVDGGGSDGDSSNEGSYTEEGWESNLERLILHSNYPQHLLLLLLHPSLLGPLHRLRYLHLHSTLKNSTLKSPNAPSSFPDVGESDEEDPPLSLNWVTHPRYGTGNYGTNSLSAQRLSIAPAWHSLSQRKKTRVCRSPWESKTGPPPPPQAVVHVELPLLQFIAASFPRLEMLVLDGLWNVGSLMLLENIPSTLDPPHEIAASCLPVVLRIPVDFERNAGVQARTQGLVSALERALKQNEASSPQKSGPPCDDSTSALKIASSSPVKWWRRFFKH